ncbi:MAG TPA: M1 family aminopeptidase [Vicinamibacterales bacterium]|nr:M1 family aminopeptidase [Vicinamibacterales bacterium]
MVTLMIVMALAATNGFGQSSTASSRPRVEADVGRGVSEALARERAAVVRDLRYDVFFAIPADRQEAVRGRVIVRLTLDAPHRLVFDFVQPAERLHAVAVNGRAADVRIASGHLIVPAGATRAGANEVAFDFIAGDDALNRGDEFLYTLFVPARAQLTFPCFDQPDLKARYSLTLEVPPAWQAVANGAELAREASGPAARIRFAETPPLPTYLFAFAAGRFAVETAERNGRTFRMFHRETDAAKVARNRDAIFDLHARSLAWLEDYTGIPYPWGKFDFVLIPSFQFGGMEHAGAILYNQSGLMLEESATQNQLLERASVIAHETAHMWFGDLVTMRWFDDVWMKEVFANFMAAKIVNPSFPQVNHELRFLLAHYPAAYQVDRTAGTNPIRQPLANLNDAGQLYGPIIYQKAPIMMRQLEMIVGERAFREGVREYLARYAYGNATWLDLIRVLDARTPEDLAAWSRAWVEERGRPEIETALSVDSRGRIRSLTLTARDPFERGLVWPQRLRVALGYPDGVRELPVFMNASRVTVPEAAGLPRPQFVLPAGGGLGYGLFLLDEASLAFLVERIEDVPDPLTRGSAWVTLWDNMLEGRMAPAVFLEAAMRALPAESDEQNVQRLLAYVTRTFWRFLPPEERAARNRALEALLGAGIEREQAQSRKAAWFNAYRDTVLSRDGLAWLERVWRREAQVPGLTFSEVDEIAMALELAVREVPGWQEILRVQHERTQNPDRKARFAFVMPALSADPREREAAFERFRRLENRRREPWVLESLQYLNHPLRAAHAERFVRPALELLREIQQTGDIFFPARWMEATLWGHRSPRVAANVREFLAGNPNYPMRLRWTILHTADELFRAAGL